MSVTREILRTYRAPRKVMRRLLETLQRDSRPEARLLIYLLTGCLIVFVGQVPGLLAIPMEASDAPPPEALLGITFFAWLVVWPLLFYVLAAFAHGIYAFFQGQGDHMGSRAALFWTVLTVSPLMLLRGMVMVAFGGSPQLIVVDFVVGVAFCAIWAISLFESEASPPK